MSDSSNSIRCLSSHTSRKNLIQTDIPEGSTLAERIAYGVSHPDDWHFIHTILRLYPDRHACALARRYCAILSSKTRFEANTDLRSWINVANECGISINADFHKIEEMAEERSKNAMIAMKWGGKSESGQYKAVSQYVKQSCLEPKEPDDHKGGTITQAGCIKRMIDKDWWRKALRRKLQQERERIAMKLGLVCKKKDIYCSREAKEDNLAQQAKNQALLESMVATDGKVSLTLAEIAKSNVSNPEVRYAELMTRLKGLEQLMHDAGQEAIFVTVTCPSRMHSILSKSGRPNEKYDGTTPQQAHKYLQETWQRCRAKLNRQNIPLEGMRIAEPHHDGCPHWHLALSTDPDKKQELIEIIEDYFTREDPDEKGIENRVKIEFVKSIAGYLSKYISKNIDGKHVEKDFHGKNAKDSAVNVRAWASLWGIRQFQPIGGASVTTYRELRRIREIDQVPTDMQDIWQAADSGDWAEYERLQGGLNTPKSTHKINVLYAWSDKPNRFDEVTGKVIVGLSTVSNFLDTRPKTWTIEKAKDLRQEFNVALAEAMGSKVSYIEDYQSYAASIVSGVFFTDKHEIEVVRNADSGARVQLFTQGQGGGAPLAVAPTGAQNLEPTGPPDPEQPPIDSYTDIPDSLQVHPDEPTMPEDWDSYASLFDEYLPEPAKGAA